MNPDFQRAAIVAAETLINSNVTTTPVSPFPILKKINNVRLIPFAEVAETVKKDRETVIDAFGIEAGAAVTTMIQDNGKTFYFVAYNQFTQEVLLQRALARELGHIALGHDGSRPVDVRMAEAYCFAHHLLTPRAVIKMLLESPHPLTMNTLCNVTGCNKDCVERLQKIPGVEVPAELNRKIRELFAPRLNEYFRYQSIIQKTDTSDIIDFGTFMDGYIE